MVDETRLAIRNPEKSGTISNQGDRLKLPHKASEKAMICVESTRSREKPAIAKTTRAIVIDGTVV